MRYAKFNSRFWKSKKIKALSMETKALGAYLISSPHSNQLGCYLLPLGYITIDLGIDKDKVIQGINELEKIGFLKYCYDTEYVFICKYLSYDMPLNSNSWKGLFSQLEEIPNSLQFKSCVFSALEEIRNKASWGPQSPA